MKNYIKASPDEYGFYTDEELEDLRQQRERTFTFKENMQMVGQQT